MIFENCGTAAGYLKHIRRKDVACDSCRLAHNNKNRIDHARHKEKRNENRNEYRKKYPEAQRNIERKRRAQKLENGFDFYTENQVLMTYGNICHICNNKIDLNASRWIGRGDWEYGLHIDHLVPISKGGADTLQNVRPSHALCNIKKGDREDIKIG